MTFNIKEYDQINHCIQCSTPIKVVKLAYIKKKIEGISENELKTLKLCSKCKRIYKWV
ncbi:Mut7-C RNAse domain-containing protein [Alkaliphilus transvaalensis]|uniref:Mut7-C RNAse domain-containing protein n=1 Tax=Alkaliphilus transvaalensis TaxID=114628 RepID=UPI0012EC741E|nr:Mut7-C RNAse domain-containing protein [Alkaliphilus transvaalensis]